MFGKFIVGNLPTIRKVHRRALPPPLTATPAAVNKIRNLLIAKPDTHGVVIGVKRRGCNGLSYTMNYAHAYEISLLKTQCVVVNMSNKKLNENIKIFIESSALFHIVGTVMDFEKNDLLEGFTFTNPNEKGVVVAARVSTCNWVYHF